MVNIAFYQEVRYNYKLDLQLRVNIQTMQIPPVNENEYDEYGEDDEAEYEEIYENNEEKIKKYIEDNFSTLLKFSLEFPGDSLIEWGNEYIVDKKVNLPIDITDSLLEDIDTSDANQVSVKFELKAKVNYTAKVFYVSTKEEFNGPEGKAEHGREELTRDFDNSTELNVEVTFTLPKKKNDSLCNMSIKMEPSDEEEIVVYAIDYEEEYDDEHE